MTFVKKFTILVLFILTMPFITACSDNDNDNDGGATLLKVIGTAATGAPIVGDVELLDANNATSGLINIGADGSFSIDVSNMTAPFLLQATNLDGDTYHSLATGAGVTNISPLTDLALYIASETSPSELYSDWVNVVADLNSSTLSSDLDAAAQKIYANLETVYSDNGLEAEDFDFFSTPFQADGTGLDAVLDAINVEINAAAPSIAEAVQITRSDSSALIPFNIDIDLSQIDFDGDGSIGDISGNWTLTVSVGGITAVTINNVPAPDDLSIVEEQIESQAGDVISNVQISVLEDTATRKEFDISYDIQVDVNGQSISQTISANYVYVLN